MIYRFSQDLEANLHAREFPVVVQYEPQRMHQTGHYSALITVARDTSAGDSVDPPMGYNNAPRRHATRGIGVVLDILAQSPVAGARAQDHQHFADAIVDAVVVALLEWCKAARAGTPKFNESRFLSADEFDASEIRSGAVYRMRFTVARGVEARRFTGADYAIGTVGGATSTAQISADGTTYEEVP